MDDIDIWELNEAFAVQVVYCRDKLGIPMEKLNLDGLGSERATSSESSRNLDTNGSMNILALLPVPTSAYFVLKLDIIYSLVILNWGNYK